MLARGCAAALLAVALTAAACGDKGGPAPTPTVSPTPQPTPPTQLLHFQGRTFAFDYPKGWHIWSQSYNLGAETVVMANIPQATNGRGGLSSGAVKIDFASSDNILTGDEPPQNAQLLSFPPSNVKFFLSRGGEVPWFIQGEVRIEGRLYIISVLMETEQPATEAVAPILGSWQPVVP